MAWQIRTFRIISPSTAYSGIICSPELCAQTCVYLASGKAKELRGRYINSERDVESMVEQADIVKKENLYDLGIRELGGDDKGEGELVDTLRLQGQK